MLTREIDEASMALMARRLGAAVQGGEVILLSGPMGAGKTTFTRALAEGMGIERPSRVRSPTYTICMRHAGPIELVHLDLFRLGEGAEGSAGQDVSPAFGALGLGEVGPDEDTEDATALSGPGRVLVVEWSELWSSAPPEHIAVEISRVEGREDVRRLTAKAVSKDGEGLLLRAWGDEPKAP